ncbi:hypothetical protein N9937_00960 [bacterium]|nr:hypothetical protein [bacterium]
MKTRFYITHAGRKKRGTGVSSWEVVFKVLRKESREIFPKPLKDICVEEQYYDVPTGKHVAIKEVRIGSFQEKRIWDDES